MQVSAAGQLGALAWRVAHAAHSSRRSFGDPSRRICCTALPHLNFEWAAVPTELTIGAIKEAVSKRHGGGLPQLTLYKNVVRSGLWTRIGMHIAAHIFTVLSTNADTLLSGAKGDGEGGRAGHTLMDGVGLSQQLPRSWITLPALSNAPPPFVFKCCHHTVRSEVSVSPNRFRAVPPPTALHPLHATSDTTPRPV